MISYDFIRHLTGKHAPAIQQVLLLIHLCSFANTVFSKTAARLDLVAWVRG